MCYPILAIALLSKAALLINKCSICGLQVWAALPNQHLKSTVMRRTGGLEWPRCAGWMGRGRRGRLCCCSFAIAVPLWPVSVLNDFNLRLVLQQMHSCSEGGGGATSLVKGSLSYRIMSHTSWTPEKCIYLGGHTTGSIKCLKDSDIWETQKWAEKRVFLPACPHKLNMM